MTGQSQIPDELRVRLLRQRKRQRLVRFSFAITIAVTVILLFGIQQAQMLAPTARSLFVRPAGGQLWAVDQHFDLNAQGKVSGSFAIMQVGADSSTEGTRYDGLVNAVTHAGDGVLGVTTGPRYLEFDLTTEGWPRKRMETLELDDPAASVAVLHAGGITWACWTAGKQVMVKPLDRADVAPHSVHTISSEGATLGGATVEDRIWLTVGDRAGEKLSLVAFKPAIIGGDKPETGVEILARKEIAEGVRRVGLAVVNTSSGDVAVCSYTRRDERAWKIVTFNLATMALTEAPLPERIEPLSRLELSNFMSLGSSGSNVLAVFNDGKVVKSSTGSIADGKIEWAAAETLPIDRTQGIAPYIIWLVILCAVLLLMASQGVWLLLNRERPGDRTLASMLEQKLSQDTQKIAKPEPKLPYASSLQRMLALFIDIAITSPIVILLQDVYDYTWEQAYGFLAFGTVAQFDGALAGTLLATVVTLLVLVIYSAIGEVFWGKTFGKSLMRIRVVDLRGDHPSAWRIVVRNLLKVVELVHFLVLLIPMVMMMISGKQQRLGDVAAGTCVIVDAVADEATDDLDM